MPLTTKLITAPTIEPVTLAEMEMHLRIESNDTAAALTSTQTIAPADHAVAAAYSLEGTGVDVLNSGTVVYLVSGTNAATGTVNAKIQESDDDVTYTDVTSGAFTEVTTANDNATQEKAYTGIKQYIRVVASVAAAACSFGVNIVTSAPQSIEDDYITGLIKAARRLIERHSGRCLITQTWDRYLDAFPSANYMQIPSPPLQSITSVKYYDTDGTEATFTSDDYEVDIYGEPGHVVLGYSKTWPSTTLRTVNGVIVRYVCGYGATAATVPEEYKQAIKILGAELYEHREDGLVGTIYQTLPWAVKGLIGYDRIIPI